MLVSVKDNSKELKMDTQVVSGNGIPAWKRVLDFSVLLLTAPVWLPLGCLVALAVRISSRGPMFFRQERIGYRGRTFLCFKFRTMHIGSEQGSHQQHFSNLIRSSTPMTKLDAKNDSRLISGGNWIRASGLDELPQLLNVLRGDMSIVGPRPCIPYEFEMYDAAQRHRFDAPPGLTGLWQVSGKNRTTFAKMIELDIEYGRRMSVWLDLKILLRTAPAMARQVVDLAASKRARKSRSKPAESIPSTNQVNTQNILL